MSNFDYNESSIQITGYLDKEKILSLVTEEEIFSMVLGYEPEEFQYLCSPFREDNSPGCWFERGQLNGKLVFMDYADPSFNRSDCFDWVKRYFQIPNFYQTLVFIKDHLISGKPIDEAGVDIKSIREKAKARKKRRCEIFIKPRNFNQSDKLIWSKYGISRANLEEDKVIPASKYILKNTKKGDLTCLAYTNCYAYTDFEENRKKLYFPLRYGKGRFITNCTQNDVGGINKISSDTSQIIITKSYKDYRVLKNRGANVVWFQNEGMFPHQDLLLSFLSNYTDIVVFFDNDETGKEASSKLVGIINNLLPGTARSIIIPEENLSIGIKDPSDMYFLKGMENLKQFLIENKVEIWK